MYTYIEKRSGGSCSNELEGSYFTNNKLLTLTDMLVGNTTLCKTQQDRQCTYNGTLRHVRIAISITYCEGVLVNLVICHAMRKSHIVICGLPRSTVFSTFSHDWHDFEKKLPNSKCVLISSTTFV